MAHHTSPLVSVVTITMNNADGLRKTLASLRRARERGGHAELFDVHVIDGKSTDHTDEVFAQFRDMDFDFLSEPDRGIYDAMNKGTARARGEYVHYLNAGDELAEPETYLRIKKMLDAHEGRLPLWLAGRAYYLGKYQREIDCIPYSWWEHAMGIRPNAHQATFFRKAFVDLIGGYSEDFDFAGDFDLIMKIGAIEEPMYLDWIVATFEGDGISDARASEIPKLIQAVRRARMNLTGIARSLDDTWVRYVETDSFDAEAPEVRMFGLKRRAEHERIMLRSDMKWDVNDT